MVGKYSSSIDNMHTRYARPQENGNRTDTRWAKFSNGKGSSIQFISDELFDFSASHFTQEDLDSVDPIRLPLKNMVNYFLLEKMFT